MHGFACVFLPHFLQTTPFPARSERVSATALKPPRKAGGRGGESTARQPVVQLMPMCKYSFFNPRSNKKKYLFKFFSFFILGRCKYFSFIQTNNFCIL
ncbi:hypothetical protein GFU58_06475 [Escherichia coli]|nr:hypothetical protein [Escherichia coli]EFA3961262.1 hypothetical protein [Escherichia coli]EFA4325604.1 hypothetical protein [Escherichia coli]EFB1873752.1 hypothetical protein [Escherichia coli]EFB1897175.1 hypothetical protein [Escherichia coli]